MKFFSVCLSLVSILAPVKFIAQLDLDSIPPTRPIAFINPPRLLYTGTTSNNVSAPATYYFTITHPPDAQEPIYKITIKQLSGEQTIQFNLNRTQVFMGKQAQLSQLIPAQVTKEQRKLTIIVNSPISPGTTFTLALRPTRNPDSEGTYFLGVTAFPAGENVDSQFLGFGRLQFHDSNGAE